jgi:RNA polymerase sigma-70 factor (ECF subfamily)
VGSRRNLWGSKESSMAEPDLVQKAKTGDREAFGELVALYMQGLSGFCYRMLHDRHDADDVVQDTFLKAYEKIWTVKANHTFRPWLYKIAHNLCIDLLTERKRIPTLLDDDAVESIPDSTATPEEEVIKKDISELVAIEVNKLPLREKAIILLVHYGEFSNNEAADVLGIETKTLKPAKSDAIKRLSGRLKPMF